MPPQRIRVPRFIGGTNLLISRQMSDERTINLFQETTRGGGKVEKGLRPSEGMRQHAVVNATDTSAAFSQDGRAWTVTGTVLAEIFADGSVIERGTVDYDGTKATMASNGSAGHQLGVCSAKKLYVLDLDTNVFTLVADFQSNNVDVRMIEFMDGYLFALQEDTRRVYYSALEDMLTWDFTFGYLERSWGSDNISFIKRAGRQLWFVGTLTSEVWADNGNAEIPFAPIQGAFLDIGSCAPFSGVRDGATITWLSQDERGAGMVVRAAGYDPEQVSTPAIATMIQLENSDLSTSEAFVHQIGGHQFYWLYVPGLDTTPVFDFLEGIWSERAMWNKVYGIWEPHVARCHMYAFQKNLVGVRDNGVIYHLSPDYKDNVLIV